MDEIHVHKTKKSICAHFAEFVAGGPPYFSDKKTFSG